MCQVPDGLGKVLVEDWLAKYMFAGKPNATSLARHIAEFFGNYMLHKSHAIGSFGTRREPRVSFQLPLPPPRPLPSRVD